MGKSAPSAPAAPDPVVVANAQAAANTVASKDTARLSNPNITNPYGSQTVTYGGADTIAGNDYFRQHPELSGQYLKQFVAPKLKFTDPLQQDASSWFMQNPNATQSEIEAARQEYAKLNKTDSIASQNAVSTVQKAMQDAMSNAAMTPYEYALANYNATGKELGYGAPTAPDKLTPNVVQTLNPQQQAILNEQNKSKLGLANLANTGVKNVSDVLNKPFSFGGPAVQTSLAKSGDLATATDASQFMAGGGPNAGNYMAGAGPSAANFVANNLLDTSNVAAMPINAGTTAQEAIMSRLNPTLAKNRVSTETQLINQGLRPGTEAYNNAIQLLGQQENDQRTQAVLQGLGLDMSANAQGYGQAVTSGQFGNQAQAQNFNQGNIEQQLYNQSQAQNYGQAANTQQLTNSAQGQNYSQGLNSANFTNAAQNQLYNQNLASAQFANTAQQQALAQALQQRNLPINEITALLSGSQITNPQFTPYSGTMVGAAPIAQTTQNAYQGALNNYNQQVGSQNAQTAGLFQLGAAALMPAPMFSDRRLKSNIHRIGTHKLGIGIYEYDIMGRHEIGVMAQEVEKVMPDAISRHHTGYMMVDYGRINA
jgi:hypothetical protein